MKGKNVEETAKDLWSDSWVKTGEDKNSIAAFVLHVVSLSCCSRLDQVIVLCWYSQGKKRWWRLERTEARTEEQKRLRRWDNNNNNVMWVNHVMCFRNVCLHKKHYTFGYEISRTLPPISRKKNLFADISKQYQQYNVLEICLTERLPLIA